MLKKPGANTENQSDAQGSQSANPSANLSADTGKTGVPPVNQSKDPKKSDAPGQQKAPIINTLLIQLKTKIPNFTNKTYLPSMSIPSAGSGKIYFDPLVLYDENAIRSISTNKESIMRQFFEKSRFDLMKGKFSKRLSSLQESAKNKYVDENIRLTLKTLLNEKDLFYIDGQPFTIMEVHYYPEEYTVEPLPAKNLTQTQKDKQKKDYDEVCKILKSRCKENDTGQNANDGKKNVTTKNKPVIDSSKTNTQNKAKTMKRQSWKDRGNQLIEKGQNAASAVATKTRTVTNKIADAATGAVSYSARKINDVGNGLKNKADVRYNKLHDPDDHHSVGNRAASYARNSNARNPIHANGSETDNGYGSDRDSIVANADETYNPIGDLDGQQGGKKHKRKRRTLRKKTRTSKSKSKTYKKKGGSDNYKEKENLDYNTMKNISKLFNYINEEKIRHSEAEKRKKDEQSWLDTQSYVAFQIEVELVLFPGKDLTKEQIKEYQCQYTKEKIKESWAKLTGKTYYPGPMNKPKNKTNKANNNNNNKNTNNKNNKTNKIRVNNNNNMNKKTVRRLW